MSTAGFHSALDVSRPAPPSAACAHCGDPAPLGADECQHCGERPDELEQPCRDCGGCGEQSRHEYFGHPEAHCIEYDPCPTCLGEGVLDMPYVGRREVDLDIIEDRACPCGCAETSLDCRTGVVFVVCRHCGKDRPS